MISQTIFEAASYGAGLLGGLALFIYPITERGRAAPHWIRVALWCVGPLAVAWASFGFALLTSSQSSAPELYARLYQFKTLCAGACEGILLVLFASGEFMRLFSRAKSVA